MDNYKDFISFINNLDYRPKLLLHSCCGPCSTSVLELLTKYFDVYVFYFNPNIYPENEFIKRKEEQKRLLKELNVSFIEADYDTELYDKEIKGLENEPEGGIRCRACINYRMLITSLYAKNNNYDYFTTTLSVSPHKNSKMINEIGYNLEKKIGVKYLYSDFKKQDGYKRSIELSKKYNLYRQDYCGCKYSLNNKKNINKDMI